MKKVEDRNTLLLENILIALLALGGVGQKEIKSIVGVGSDRVNKLAKLINTGSKQTNVRE